MAANLNITSALKEAFEAACRSGNTRCVRAGIIGETIGLSPTNPTLPAEGTSEEDFATLNAEKTSPQYYLWNVDPNNSSEWVLVAYVLDTCKVRDKMLYASSHKNLVQTLGASLFKGTCYMNDESEFIYSAVTDAMRSATAGAPLTQAEEARKLEEEASKGQGISQSGMSSLPFQLTPAATEAVASLQDSTTEGSTNFVELCVTDTEAVDLCAAKSVQDGSEITSNMDKSNGRFYALRYPTAWMNSGNSGAEEGKLFFILSCPDATPVKQRMILSVVKSTVLEACTAAGLSFFKMLEVQDVEDIENEMINEIISSREDRSLKNEAAFTKPKGPGGRRGKRRMMKSKK